MSSNLLCKEFICCETVKHQKTNDEVQPEKANTSIWSSQFSLPVTWKVARNTQMSSLLILVCSCVQLRQVEEGMVCLSNKDSFVQSCAEVSGSNPLVDHCGDIQPGWQTTKLCRRYLHPPVPLPIFSGSLLCRGWCVIPALIPFNQPVKQRENAPHVHLARVPFIEFWKSVLWLGLAV